MARKRGPAPIKRDEVIANLKSIRRATSAELGASTAYLTALAAKGFVKVVDNRAHEGRGRPENVYGLTSRGRNRAKTLAKKAVAA